MKDTFTVRVPSDLRRELNKISRSERVPISDLIRESLRHYLTARAFRRLRKKTLPFAEAQGLLTDEDIFNRLS